jgi:hypothetical protein
LADNSCRRPVANGGFLCRDLNSFGRTLYPHATLSFFAPHDDGDALAMARDQILIYHPVLFKDDYKRKMEKLAQIAVGETWFQRYRRRLLPELNARTAWR